MKLITGGQVRAARALLRWSADDLAEEARLGVATVRRAEATDGVPAITEANCAAMKSAFERAGIDFIEENGGGPGVRIRKGGRASSDHPEPRGPATEAVRSMDSAIESDRNKTRRR